MAITWFRKFTTKTTTTKGHSFNIKHNMNLYSKKIYIYINYHKFILPRIILPYTIYLDYISIARTIIYKFLNPVSSFHDSLLMNVLNDKHVNENMERNTKINR